MILLLSHSASTCYIEVTLHYKKLMLHVDSYVQVTIESDCDIRCTLTSFLEASQRNESSQFRTLHVQECMQVMLERDGHSEPLNGVAPVEAKS